ncbi:unnamed protein product [Owenia fusiformis]|uniref:Uncharacterized protein n=1 Tax=Owenia fusiformis TaxID=6347 RepID=A0A8J1T598_OWEFU|nr:unnamed protein product [Owenia fusiformis]
MADISDSGNYTCQYVNEVDNLPIEIWTEVRVWAYCYPPRLPDHATYTPRLDEYGEGRFINFSCNEGYALSGNATVQCVPSGHVSSWSAENQNCSKISFQQWLLFTISGTGAGIFVILVVVLAVCCYKRSRRKRNVTRTDPETSADQNEFMTMQAFSPKGVVESHNLPSTTSTEKKKETEDSASPHEPLLYPRLPSNTETDRNQHKNKSSFPIAKPLGSILTPNPQRQKQGEYLTYSKQKDQSNKRFGLDV